MGGEGEGEGEALKKELCVSDLNTSDFLEETRVWVDGHPLWKRVGPETECHPGCDGQRG